MQNAPYLKLLEHHDGQGKCSLERFEFRLFGFGIMHTFQNLKKKSKTLLAPSIPDKGCSTHTAYSSIL